MAADKRLPRIGPWPRGIDNRHRETDLLRDQMGRTVALRSATNVDIDRSGIPQRRAGTTKVVNAANFHSLFADPAFGLMLASNNNALTAYDTALKPTVLQSGLSPFQPLSYACINGEVYWSNGFDCGKVRADGTVTAWGVEKPLGTPNAVPSAAGGMNAGQYQVALNFVTFNGEEGGSTLAVVVTVAEGGGIQLSQIPQPTSLDVVAARAYITSANGDVLYWSRDIPVGMTSVTLGQGPLGKALETQWLSPMPPGQIVRYGNGRLWVASGNVVYYSEPLQYGQVRLSRNFMTFSDEIAVMEYPNEGDGSGLFVAAGKRTYFIAGQNPKDAQLRIVHPYGAVKGTGATVPGNWFDSQLGGNVAYWMDADGIPCLGLAGGTIRPLTTETYLAPIAESGATLVREINGMRQVLTNLRGTGVNQAAASDVAVATVTRNGLTT